LKRIFFLLLVLLLLSGCTRISRDELENIEKTIGTGNYPLAILTLDKLTTQYPNDPIGYYLLGFSSLKNDDPSKALKAFRKTFEIKKNYSTMVGDIDVVNFLAGNSLSGGDTLFMAAMREIDTIFLKHKEGEVQDRIRYHKAMLLLLAKEYGKAVNELQQVMDNDFHSGYDSMAQLKIGIIKVDFLHQESEGLKEVEKVLTLYPGSEEAPEAMFWLAEQRRKAAQMFGNRAESLEKFYNSWDNVKEFEAERKEAIAQARKDRARETESFRSAIEVLNDLIKRFPNSTLSSDATEVIKNMNQSKNNKE